MKHKFLCILIILILTINYFNTKAFSSSIEVGADSAILIDAETGKILYQKNIHKKQYPASITKIMTAILALENGNLDDIITYSKKAVFSIEPGSSHIAIDVGEKLTLRQALYALLLVSANDAANGIAEYIDGSIENFAKHMTAKAKELGAKDTNFVNPHGLHNKNHYTTAYDMSLIAREALNYPKFRKIISTLYYKIPPTNKKNEPRPLGNQHKMFKNTRYHYDGCEGGKTGYTNQAQHTLVTYAKRGNLELICIILHDNASSLYTDTAKLFDYGFNNYQKIHLLNKNTIVDRIPVFNTPSSKESELLKLGYLSVIAKNDFIYIGNKNIDKNKIIVKTNLPDKFFTPISKNDIVGEISYIYNGTVLGTVPLLATQTYEKIGTKLKAVIQQNNLKNSISTKQSFLFSKSKYIIMSLLLLLAFTSFYVLLKIIRKTNN